MSIWDWLLNPSGLTPHGFCLSWAPGLVTIHVVSDVLIGLSYFSIPLAIAAFVRRRPDLQYGWVAYLFVAFILACGTTHLMAILTLWVPAYGIEGLIKMATAILSIATAAILWPLIPRAAALPSVAQLEQLNLRLRESEAEARLSNLELERRVAERTSQLERANAQLTEALAERSQAQQALARNEAEYRASFEAAAVGKIQTDPLTGKYIRVNRAFAHMLGYEPEDLIGQDGWSFTWPEDREEGREGYARLLAGEVSTYHREKRYLRRDGQPVWGRLSGSIVRDPETNEPLLSIGVVEDIDERHKAQAALETAKRDLEDMVEARTAALRQRDLLLREVYHRVKNNLQIVDSLLVMQARQVSDPGAKEALLSLRSRVYALGLVHHQLMGSTNLSTFDVAPFLHELSTNVVEGGADQNIELNVEAIPLEVGLDFAIPLGLLVTELVTNALKHAFPGRPGTIDVMLRRGADGSIALIVADNGVGYAADGAHAGGTGSGLGASIIKGLVLQMGGMMSVAGDKGTRVEIRFAAPVAS
ncbi:MAG: PAS domain S-box protein [Phenylobacterium sp.]|uniref:sensor histidine kinase n=1 Tax=Phenylobacterium sp. TaxID=1871053 RepID=UPI00272790C6|nr:PAS domain S-box protein [Phenylobacterium sp.]MDO8323766.1 PAS domain S-box protein [Phenylobacterium sp.]MDO8911690.1 PAS domain S-box protein [Phenylobacterium sp.]MDO9247699.1 PAS domain S-box protein [Phenylobacterium sp.]MDP3099851.1 PAS domain S-box protein [Phenylobacterium sp.]MDP3632296.1 PAS domain S-box protein [Phenylobacterium sp.]